MKKIFVTETQVKKMNNIPINSLTLKDELNGKVWNDDKLNRKVSEKLLKIADDFLEYTGINWVKPSGVVIVGSICNYNWSRYSDIDLHIKMDYKKVDERTDFVQDYFDAKKNLWNQEHKNLKIFGYHVELYVQDVKEAPESQGEYDLVNDRWIRKPKKDEDANDTLEGNKKRIKKDTTKIINQIIYLKKSAKEVDDKRALKGILTSIDGLFDKLKNRRKKGLASKDGEYSVDNLVYKCVRRSGYFDVLWDLSSYVYDKINSLTESANIFENIRRGDLLMLVNEEVNADGNANHNPYAKRWKQEREMLKSFILNNGQLMTSKENGKTYKVYWEQGISNLIGVNYALCLQYDPATMEDGSTVYIRALSKFTERMFQANFDTRGRDNVQGTSDDTI